METEKKMNVAANLETAWRRLADVSELQFQATSNASGSGWNGAGNGTVAVEKIDAATMLFREQGTWVTEAGKEINFSNIYCWAALPEEGLLRLEHLRFGPSLPVYLFDLQPSNATTWVSTEPHVCRDDLYSATMELETEAIVLHWTVAGPTKNESIRYLYR